MIFSLFNINSIAKKPSLSDLQNQQHNNSKKLNELSDQLGDVKKGLSKTYIDLEKTKGELEITNTKYQIAIGTYNETKQEYDDLNRRLASSKQFQLEITKQIDENSKNLAESKKQMGILARNYLQNSGVDNTLLLLIGAKNVEKVKEQYFVYQTVQRSNQNILNTYRQTMGYSMNNQSRLEQVNAIISDLDEKAKVSYAKAGEAKIQTETEKAKLDSLKASLDSKASNLESKKALYIKEMKERDAINKALASKIAKITDSMTYGNGTLGLPLTSIRVSQSYGWRIHPIYGRRSFHTGVDLSASCGTPIYSAGAGKVVSVGWNSAYGNRTEISHGKINGKNFVSTYNHQSSTSVSVGQIVKKGQEIGKVGTTGWSTGCHLHFEIYINGSTVNPMSYI
jgi:murein DD-endopeptidase MepM/ murein hydrolase activator NlpD